MPQNQKNKNFLKKTKKKLGIFWNVKKEMKKKYVWKPEMSEEYFFF